MKTNLVLEKLSFPVPADFDRQLINKLTPK